MDCLAQDYNIKAIVRKVYKTIINILFYYVYVLEETLFYIIFFNFNAETCYFFCLFKFKKDFSVTATQVRPKSGLATIAPTAIVWRDAAHILISGTSHGGVRVTANESNSPFGEALVLADGTWQIAGSLNLKKIKHRLRFELLSDGDKILANYTLPLTSRDLAKGQNGTPLVVVNKGDALWRIAYRQFGDGIRYVDIVRRNQRDIVDPDLIYPKQIFALPKSAKEGANQN